MRTAPPFVDRGPLAAIIRIAAFATLGLAALYALSGATTNWGWSVFQLVAFGAAAAATALGLGGAAALFADAAGTIAALLAAATFVAGAWLGLRGASGC